MQPPVVQVLNEAGSAPYVLVCEHASRYLPPEYASLGLTERDLSRHIGWDIGAEVVARQLSVLLDAPLVVAGYSRLLIDLNRPPYSPTSIPALSEATIVPGNQGLDDRERKHRIETYFHPFHDQLGKVLTARQRAGKPTALIGVHSFTPIFHGFRRPWSAGVLYRRSTTFGAALVEALGGDAASVAHNQPYQIEDDSDYTVPVQGEARGIEAVLVELRQDLIGQTDKALQWATRLAAALTTLRP